MWRQVCFDFLFCSVLLFHKYTNANMGSWRGVGDELQLHTYIYWIHTDAMITDARIKDAGRTSLEKYSPLTLLQGFKRLACERMLETEHKLHILTPLLWPSRCVFIVLLMLGSTPSGLSEGPLGRVWPSLPHLVSTVWKSAGNSIGAFPRAPSVGCGLPYHIWSLAVWNSAGNCSGTQTQLS